MSYRISENGIRWFDRTVSLVGIASFFKHDFIFIPWPVACRTTLQNVPNIAKRILMSDPWSRVGVFGQTGPISLEQPDLRGTDTFVYLAWMLGFGNFAGSGHQQPNIALAVSSSPFHPPLWERFWQQSDVRSWCHVVFWPRDSNTIFEGKMAQLWRLVKSLLLTPDVSNIGIAYLTK